MNNKTIIGAAVALVLVLGFGAGFIGSKLTKGDTNLSGVAYEALVKWMGNGFYAGLTQQLTVDSDGDLTTSGTVTFNGAVTTSATSTDAGGLACKSFSGTFADATTTLFALLNPFGATSSAMYASVEVTTGTTSVALKIGTSTTPYPTLASSVSAGLMNAPIGTSSVERLVTVGNNITDTGVAANSMEVGPGLYITGHASSTNSMADHNGGILGGSNGFSGSYKLQVCR